MSTALAALGAWIALTALLVFMLRGIWQSWED